MVYQRYAYWYGKGHVERLFQGVQQPDMEEVMMDSTCCRAHQSSAGARKTHGPQAIGITRTSAARSSNYFFQSVFGWGAAQTGLHPFL